VSTETEHADEREAVLRVERETMQAIRGKDVAALRDLLAEEFVYRTPGATDAGRAQFLDNIAAIPFELLAVWGEEQHVFLSGETAVLTGVQHARYRADDGTEGISTVAFADVLVKRGGRWLLALAQGVELPNATESEVTL